MATVITDDTNYTNIANAIRGKNGEATQYKPSEMAAAITNLPTGGGANFEITDASYLFYRNARIDVINELLALCKNVIDTECMFNGCSALTSLDLSSFNTSKVTNMQDMFNGCSALTSLDLSSFNTSKVTNMQNIFYGCYNLKYLDISSFDTSKVRSFLYFFYNCRELTSLDLRNFDTTGVYSMQLMFNGCNNLKSLDLSSFNTSKVTNMSGMFGSCNNLTALIINNPKLFELKATNCFNNASIENGTGYVYVPDDMVDTYKAATNWSVYADQIKPISELPEEV